MHLTETLIKGPLRPREVQRAASLLHDALVTLKNAGVDTVALPCNTLQGLFVESCLKNQLRPLNMIDEALSVAAERGFQSVTVLSTFGESALGAYAAAAAHHGLKVTPLPSSAVRAIADIVWRSQAFEKVATRPQALLDIVEQGLQDTDGVILGCTELSHLASRLQMPFGVVDAMECLSRACVRELTSLE